MPAHLDPTVIPVIVALTPAVARSVVLLSAAAVSLLSRKAARRAEARRLIRLLTKSRKGRS
jgi:hypothetical protein